MSMHDKITATLTGHPDAFEVTTFSLDGAIVHYLPASVTVLRRRIDNHPNNPFRAGNFNNLDTVIECLMVLAHLDSRTA